MANTSDFTRQFSDHYRLTTAQIFYHLPDHPALLQEYIWQDYDLAPRFPELRGFLGFWEKEIEGPLHSVYIAHRRIIAPGSFTNCAFEGTLQ